PRRQNTILGDRPAQTRFERLSKQSNDPPLSRVNTLGSGEDSMKLNELMEICTKLSKRVLALENIKTTQDLEITNLKKRVKKLEKKKKSRTPQLKRRLFKVRTKSSAKKSLGDQEDASKQGRNEIDQEEGISWFQEDAETQGRYGHDIEINTASTSITTASINITIDEPFITASAPVAIAGVSVSTAEPKYDADLAQRLQAELDEEARLEREREEEAIWRLNNSLDYKYVQEILKKFDLECVRTATTPYEAPKPKSKNKPDSPVNVHLYRSMIGSLMYLTALRPDIMFAISACSRNQVTPTTSNLEAVKKIFKYLKGQPKLGLWYPRESPFLLEAYSDNDYARVNKDRKSTTSEGLYWENPYSDAKDEGIFDSVPFA
ncbi:hypothetical protein Tco_0545187, partial [Tanacetum coccineum]